jgi:hypothetical protein
MSILPNGFPGPVAANEIIESAWGNATSDSFTRLNNRLPITASVTGNGGTSGGAWPIQSYTFPAQPVAGMLAAWSHARLDFNGGTGYAVNLTIGGVFLAQWSFMASNLSGAAGANTNMVRLSGMVAIAANTAVSVQVNGAGAANVATFADPTVNRLDLLFVPYRV